MINLQKKNLRQKIVPSAQDTAFKICYFPDINFLQVTLVSISTNCCAKVNYEWLLSRKAMDPLNLTHLL